MAATSKSMSSLFYNSESGFENTLIPLDKSKTGWEIFLGPSGLRGAWTGDQELFARLRQESVDLACIYLQNNKDITAMNLYEFLAGKRKIIGRILGQSDCDGDVGRMRKPNIDNPAFTQLHPQGIYKEYLETLACRLDSYIKTPSEHYKLYNNGVTIKIDDISLSYLKSFHDTKEGILICHTPDRQLAKLYDKINAIYAEICDIDKPNLYALRNIARLAWYLAHAMPCERGSAATTDMFIYTLFKRIGFLLVAYTSPIPIDLEAIFQPDIEKFVNDFPKWFPGIEKAFESTVETYAESIETVAGVSSTVDTDNHGDSVTLMPISPR